MFRDIESNLVVELVPHASLHHETTRATKQSVVTAKFVSGF
jgi:hypothetical protein